MNVLYFTVMVYQQHGEPEAIAMLANENISAYEASYLFRG